MPTGFQQYLSDLLDGLPAERQDYWIQRLSDAGVIAPTKGGFVEELGQSFGRGMRGMAAGVGATMTEMGIPGGPAVEEQVARASASKQASEPWEGYSPTDSFTDMAALGYTLGNGLGTSAAILPVAAGAMATGTAAGLGPVAAALAGRLGASVATFASVYGHRLREFREEFPDLPEEEQKGYALFSSAIEGGIESLFGPEQLLTKGFAGETVKRHVAKAMSKGLLRGVGTGVALGAIEGGIGEAAEELMQGIENDLFREMAGADVKILDWRKRVEDMVAGLIPGFVSSGAVSIKPSMQEFRLHQLGEAIKKDAAGEDTSDEVADLILTDSGTLDASPDKKAILTKYLKGLEPLTPDEQVEMDAMLPLSNQYAAILRGRENANVPDNDSSDVPAGVRALLPQISEIPKADTRSEFKRVFDLSGIDMPPFLRSQPNRAAFLEAAKQAPAPEALPEQTTQGPGAPQAEETAGVEDSHKGKIPASAITPSGTVSFPDAESASQWVRSHLGEADTSQIRKTPDGYRITYEKATAPKVEPAPAPEPAPDLVLESEAPAPVEKKMPRRKKAPAEKTPGQLARDEVYAEGGIQVKGDSELSDKQSGIAPRFFLRKGYTGLSIDQAEEILKKHNAIPQDAGRTEVINFFRGPVAKNMPLIQKPLPLIADELGLELPEPTVPKKKRRLGMKKSVQAEPSLFSEEEMPFNLVAETPKMTQAEVRAERKRQETIKATKAKQERDQIVMFPEADKAAEPKTPAVEMPKSRYAQLSPEQVKAKIASMDLPDLVSKAVIGNAEAGRPYFMPGLERLATDVEMRTYELEVESRRKNEGKPPAEPEYEDIEPDDDIPFMAARKQIVQTTDTPRGTPIERTIGEKRIGMKPRKSSVRGAYVVPSSELTPAQSKFSAAAKAAGVSVSFFDATPEYMAGPGKRGGVAFEIGGDTYLSSSLKEADLPSVLGHELVHVELGRVLKSERAAVLDAVKESLGEAKYRDVVSSVKAQWGDLAKNEEAALVEILAEANAQRVLDGEDVLAKLSGRNPSLAERIWKAIKKAISNLTREVGHLFEGDTSTAVASLKDVASRLEGMAFDTSESAAANALPADEVAYMALGRAETAEVASKVYGAVSAAPETLRRVTAGAQAFWQKTFRALEKGYDAKRLFPEVFEALRRAAGSAPFARQKAINEVMGALKASGVNPAEQELLQKHREDPNGTPIPSRLRPVAKWIDDTYAKLEKIFLSLDPSLGTWPNSFIRRENDRIAELQTAIGELGTLKNKTDDAKEKERLQRRIHDREQKIADAEQTIETLNGLQYARRLVTGNPDFMTKMADWISTDGLKSFPKELVGRQHVTMQEVREALAGTPYALEENAFVALGDTMAYLYQKEKLHLFHQSVKENAALAGLDRYTAAQMQGVADAAGVKLTGRSLVAKEESLEDKAPDAWNAFKEENPLADDDFVKLAGYREYDGYRVHPVIVRAIQDFTEPQSASTDPGRAYDKMNTIAKQLKFYNFMVMSINNLEQGIAAAGLAHVGNLPKALTDVHTRSDFFMKCLEYDAFPTPSDLPVAEFLDDLRGQIKALDGEATDIASFILKHSESKTGMEAALKTLLPTGDNTLLTMSRHLTWQLDQAFRVATIRSLMNQGMEFDAAVKRARTFHADYNMMRQEPAKWGRRALLTVAYQYAMWKGLFFDELTLKAGENKAPIARITAMYLMAGAVASMFGYAWVEGYRYVKKEEDEEGNEKERVALMVGPFAEPWKAIGRARQGLASGGVKTAIGRLAYPKTAAIPHALWSWIRNRDWKGTPIVTPGAPDSYNNWQVAKWLVHEILPVTGQVADWSDEEQTVSDNVLRLFTITRFRRAPMATYFERKLSTRQGRLRSWAKDMAEKNPAKAELYYKRAAREFTDYMMRLNDAVKTHDVKIDAMEKPDFLDRLIAQFDAFGIFHTIPDGEDTRIDKAQLGRRLWEAAAPPKSRFVKKGRRRIPVPEEELRDDALRQLFSAEVLTQYGLTTEDLRKMLLAETRRRGYAPRMTASGSKALTGYGKRLQRLQKVAFARK